MLKLIIYLLMAAFSSPFDISFVNPKSVTVHEGDDIILSCTVSSLYYWCTFKHNDKICDFGLDQDYYTKSGLYEPKQLSCNNYQNRADFYGAYNEKAVGQGFTCALNLKLVTLDDAGEWSCILESWRYGNMHKYRGQGFKANGTMKVKVQEKFKLTDALFNGNKIMVNEGDNVTFSCTANHWYYYCTFKHELEICQFKWDFALYQMDKIDNVTLQDCATIQKRATFTGNFSNYECAIQLKHVTSRDSGKWSCELEKWYNNQQTVGFAPRVNKTVWVEVIKKFRLTEVKPDTDSRLRVEEDDNIELYCAVNEKFEKCLFRHYNKICEFKWQEISSDVSMVNCSDFMDRVEFLGKSDGKSCGIQLKSARIEDGNEWTCEFLPLYGDANGYRTLVSSKLGVTVNEKFKLTQIKPIITKVNEGDEVTLMCAVNKIYEWCSFKHIDTHTKCEMYWGSYDNKTATHCNDFNETAVFTGNPNTKICALTLKSVTLMNAGNWDCDLKLFHGYNNASLAHVKGDIQLKVIPKFSFTEITPGTNSWLSLEEDEFVELYCAVNQQFEKCSFLHYNLTCEFKWEEHLYNVSIRNCADFEGRFEFISKNDGRSCGIRLKSTKIEDGGDWTCEFLPLYGDAYGNRVLVSSKLWFKVTEKFKLTSLTTQLLEVKKGNNVILDCSVNKIYEKCSFQHIDTQNTCEMYWEAYKNKTTLNCSDYNETVVFIGHPTKKVCSLHLKSVSLIDTGLWICELKLFHGYSNGIYGNASITQVKGKIKLLITTKDPLNNQNDEKMTNENDNEYQNLNEGNSEVKILYIVSAIVGCTAIIGLASFIYFKYWYKPIQNDIEVINIENIPLRIM